MPDLSWINSTAGYITSAVIIFGALAAFKRWLWPVIQDWFVRRPAVEMKRLAFEAEWMQQHSPIAMFRLDADLNCIWVNQALRELLKANSDELEALNWFKVIHRDDREDVKNKWRIAVKDRCSYQNTQRMLAGGRYATFEVIGDPFIHGGRVIEFMGIVREPGWLE